VEVNDPNPIWLNQAHPNYLRWKRARELSIERGKFVKTIVNQEINTERLSILDLGSGEGGTAKVFSENNFVVSLDLSLIRLQRQISSVISKEGSYPTEKSSTINETRFLSKFISISSGFEMTNPELVNGSALQLSFPDQTFDLIIIQDVIEHLYDQKNFYSEIIRVLKTNGLIFLSTPNKHSMFNFFSDPHFGIPIVALLNRESIKKYFLKYLRKDDYNRNDIAQLLSLKDLEKLLGRDFEIKLFTKISVSELFKGNDGIVWSSFHLKLIRFCKIVKLDWLIDRITNDKIGIINKYFTPTFYIIIKRK
jgi:SAM-dependent methyltransferase